jgi:hypothetical protein
LGLQPREAFKNETSIQQATRDAVTNEPAPLLS